jgi:GAF domain-containing protein
LGLRLDPRRRRVEAIAEAARALAGVDRGEFVDVFLDAMLKVVPGDIALLFSNAAGDARFISASREMSDLTAGPMAQLARETMRAATARTVDELTEAQRPVPAMRSAMLVPVSVAGLDVRGVLVVLHHETAHFREADIALVRPFAQYLWVVLRSAPLPVGGVIAKAREKTN